MHALPEPLSLQEKPPHPPVPMKILTGVLLAALFITVLEGWLVFSLDQKIRRFTNTHFREMTLSSEIRHLDEALTMTSRMGAATGDPRWSRRYEELSPRLDKAIENAISVTRDAALKSHARRIEAVNDQLVAMEKKALFLASIGRREKALNLLLSPEYEDLKKEYSEGLNGLVNEMRNNTHSALFEASRLSASAGFLSLVTLPLMLGLFFLAKNALSRHRELAEQARDAEEQAMRELENRVAAATLNLTAANERLAERIEAHVEAEKKLTAFSERLFQIVEHIHSGLGVLRAVDNGDDFEFTAFNAAAEYIERRKREDVIGKRLTEVFPAAWELGVFNALQKAHRTKETIFTPPIYFRDDRSEGWREFYIFPLPSDEVGVVFEDLTEKVVAEQALRESEERLSLAVRGGKMGLWDWNISTGEVHYNELWARNLGFDLSEIEHKYETWESRIHPEDRDEVLGAVREALAGRSAYFELEHRLKAKSGQWQWVLGMGRVSEHDANGGPARMSGMMLNISRQKETEKRLADSQRRFRDVALTSGDWIWEVDADGRYVYVSDSVTRILGYQPAELIGKTPFELMPDEEQARVLPEFMRISQDRLPIHDLENWNLSKDGRRVCMLTNGVPVFDERGGLTGYSGVDKDITERKNFEATINMRLAELTALNTLSNDINADLDIESVVDRAILGVAGPITPDITLLYLEEKGILALKGIQTRLTNTPHGEDREHFANECLCGLAFTEGRSVFSKDIHADPRCNRDECKNAGIVSYAALPLVIGDRVIGVLGLGSLDVRDFSEQEQFLHSMTAVIASGVHNCRLHDRLRRHAGELSDRVAERTAALESANELLKKQVEEKNRAEEEMRKARDEARDASTAKTDFLARMSHEIRTPMNAVINMSELALLTHLDDTQREYVRSVRNSGRHLLALINDILDISKVEAGRLELENVDFDLVAVLQATVSSMSPQAADRGLYLDLATDDSFRRHFKGDPVRLQQVLVNLIGNAVKFTERGGVTVRVSCASDDCGLPDGPVGPDAPRNERIALHFTVTDTGIGIPDDKKEAIFSAFAQMDASITRRYGGTGLGLTICRELVGLMGGRIWAESQPGQGAVFHFTVHLEPGDPAKAVSAESAFSSPLMKTARRALSILLAEDNRENVRVATALVEKLGHRITALAANGRQAVDLLKKSDFDIVLMDVEMPEMDGMEATRRIRAGEAGEAAQSIPIVALTAHAMSGYREKCLAAGMDRYITKPFSLDQLADLLGRVGPDATAPEAARPNPEDGGLLNRKAAIRRFGGDEALYERVLTDFMALCPERLDRLKTLAEQGELEQIALLVHTIKGNCGTIGADSCHAAAMVLETAARERNAGRVPLYIDDLERELRRIMTEIETME